MSGGLTRVLGLALAALLALALYDAWRMVPDMLGLLPGSLRSLIAALRLPLEIAGAFLILSGADWLWRRVAGS